MRQRLAFLPALLALAQISGARADDPGLGAKVFQRCYSCHSVHPQDKALPGPNLYRVVGRPAGADNSYEYSEALRDRARNGGLVWTERNLDLYLLNPEAFLPGTTMHFPGLPEAADRASVIAYLRRAASADSGR